MLPDVLRRVFPGDSELATRLRELDWASTDVGSPETWTRSLQDACAMCLTTYLPMQIWWGDTLVAYNDACVPFLGAKHPSVLAHSGRVAWQEVLNLIAPAIERVFGEKLASWCKDVRWYIEGELPRQEAFVTFSFTPLADDTGEVAGMYCTLVETTESVIAKRRLDTLHK